MKIAILIDGAFFLNRARIIWGNLKPDKAADQLIRYCKAHIQKSQEMNREAILYRIFYYDCLPAEFQTQHPLTGETIFYHKTESSKWRISFIEALKTKRKTAIRLGKMDSKNPTWTLKGRPLTKLLKNNITIEDIKATDVQLELRQKGVDMKIGLDISSMSYKKQVEQMILIAGDSDFVPAAKTARREGIDFILDPMWLPIKAELNEHIDGLRSMIDKPDKDGNFNGHIYLKTNPADKFIKAYKKKKTNDI